MGVQTPAQLSLTPCLHFLPLPTPSPKHILRHYLSSRSSSCLPHGTSNILWHQWRGFWLLLNSPWHLASISFLYQPPLPNTYKRYYLSSRSSSCLPHGTSNILWHQWWGFGLLLNSPWHLASISFLYQPPFSNTHKDITCRCRTGLPAACPMVHQTFYGTSDGGSDSCLTLPDTLPSFASPSLKHTQTLPVGVGQVFQLNAPRYIKGSMAPMMGSDFCSM